MAEPVTPRTGKALTAAMIRAPLVPGKYHDGGGLGLYLRVEPNGSRFWIQRITIRGKRRELGLGSPPTVSLAEVRDLAFANRKLAKSGGDPLRAKREAAAVLTFEEAARKVHELHLPTWRNAKHGAQFISTLEAYVFPRIGRQNVSDVTSADVLAVLSPIWTSKAEKCSSRAAEDRYGHEMGGGSGLATRQPGRGNLPSFAEGQPDQAEPEGAAL